ncbi:hypothetical protein QJS04_geneDACA002794 [Acorus gramineus]|uniref:Bacterial Ig-like domain-containing protein n=1 Tax=Acorus gramineus TaxID=55184 RepID=A0AAV9BV71_ACOGR|nr:hypothetical protein QJS04_geneDACA002794 [Acorus gramineus]
MIDSRRPSVRLSTTSKMKTRDHSVPVLIRFMKPVFDFNSSAIIVKGGHLLSFREVSGRIYTVEIHADDTTVSVQIPENTTEDVAGNKNLVSNLLRVQHYSVPIVSQVLASVTTAAFALSSVTAMLLTLSTASLQSLGTVSRPSSYLTSEPSRNLLRLAYHIQVFAQSKWLAVTLPIEYYEFARGLQWSIPYLTLPWESHSHPFMVDSNMHVLMQSQLKRTEKDASMLGSPLTPTEYQSYFESIDIKPEAEFIRDPRSSNGWKYFERNMFWLAVIGGSLILLHALLVLILRFRRKDSEKEINYGALVVPRFEIFLTLLALPCISQASTAIVRGGSTAGVVVGVLLLGLLSILLLSLFLFLSVGITSGKLLQYKEVHREGQKSHWYQELVRVTLGPGKRGQWTWKDQPNSTRLAKLSPLFEDLRGPPKYMLSQIAAGGPDPGKSGDRSIIPSDDETEDAEAPFIQKLFGILRIYYAFLESVKRVALGVCAGLSSITASSKVPVLVILSISSFQLLFMMLKKPFIKKKVQFVETVTVAAEVGVFASCLALSEGDLSSRGERRVGIFMLVLFAIAFASQVINEWYALYRQVLHLSPDQNSFLSGSKAAIIGFLSVFLPSKLIMNLEDRVSSNSVNSSMGDSDRMRNLGAKASEPAEKPWRRQLKELARASFGRDERKGATRTSGDPSSSDHQKRSSSGGGFWGGKRDGSSDLKAKSKSLYRDLETIFSSN